MLPNQSTLAELAIAQQDGKIYAFSLGYEARHLAQQRAAYAKKCAQLDALDLLVATGLPDVVLRDPDGQEFALRVNHDAFREVYDALRRAIEEELLRMEAGIVAFLVTEEEEAELAKERPKRNNDRRSAILALCQPADAQEMPSGN